MGLTITCDGQCILRAAVPVYASDATRCEALGPALGALLATRLGGAQYFFKGDS